MKLIRTGHILIIFRKKSSKTLVYLESAECFLELVKYIQVLLLNSQEYHLKYDSNISHYCTSSELVQ